ncbi:hypothetical protein NDU88_002781 [Pleurodeles waltl]|uniref:Uncharacterized protein n=1 Tax=Pleurodeles waltl TaxID=8319 RepID=A0AAV7M3F9_PLEWA|nr:hypothetical protein NDU88_002781 [Pleurodeles waltl]
MFLAGVTAGWLWRPGVLVCSSVDTSPGLWGLLGDMVLAWMDLRIVAMSRLGLGLEQATVIAAALACDYMVSRTPAWGATCTCPRAGDAYPEAPAEDATWTRPYAHDMYLESLRRLHST